MPERSDPSVRLRNGGMPRFSGPLPLEQHLRSSLPIRPSEPERGPELRGRRGNRGRLCPGSAAVVRRGLDHRRHCGRVAGRQQPALVCAGCERAELDRRFDALSAQIRDERRDRQGARPDFSGARRVQRGDGRYALAQNGSSMPVPSRQRFGAAWGEISTRMSSSIGESRRRVDGRVRALAATPSISAPRRRRGRANLLDCGDRRLNRRHCCSSQRARRSCRRSRAWRLKAKSRRCVGYLMASSTSVCPRRVINASSQEYVA